MPPCGFGAEGADMGVFETDGGWWSIGRNPFGSCGGGGAKVVRGGIVS